MSKFSQKPSLSDPTDSIPPAPSHCQREGCEAETKILLCRVRAGNERKVGVFSEFGRKQKFADGSGSLSMSNNHVFDAWIARCSTCYVRDLYRAGKGALQSILRHTTDDKKHLVSTLADLMKR